MKIVLMLVLPLIVFAQSYGLKTFIDNANKTNGLIKAKEINIQAKKEQVEAAKSAYWPTVDVGADYALLSPSYLASPGEVGNVCKKRTKPATNRVCIRPLKTLDIRPPLSVIIRPVSVVERDFILG